MPLRYLIHVLIFLIGCQTKFSSDNQLEILAKIGDRLITRQDYLNRTEYTLRPDYCRGNQYLHKKIILNNQNTDANELNKVEVKNFTFNQIDQSIELQGQTTHNKRWLSRWF